MVVVMGTIQNIYKISLYKHPYIISTKIHKNYTEPTMAAIFLVTVKKTCMKDYTYIKNNSKGLLIIINRNF